jgi:hypothetical protein
MQGGGGQGTPSPSLPLSLSLSLPLSLILSLSPLPPLSFSLSLSSPPPLSAEGWGDGLSGDRHAEAVDGQKDRARRAQPGGHVPAPAAAPPGVREN